MYVVVFLNIKFIYICIYKNIFKIYKNRKSIKFVVVFFNDVILNVLYIEE